MSLDLNLISKVIQEKALLQAYQLGLKADHIEGSEREIWKFIEEHYKEYSSIPSHDLIKEKFDISLPTVTDPVDFWVNEAIERSLHRELVEVSFRIDKKLNESKPSEAFEMLRSFIRSIGESKSKGNVVSTRGSMVEELKQSYLDAEAGKMGVKTPWARMDEMTLGWWPGDVSWFSARLGVGKTFMAINIANAAINRDNKKVLFISGEMSKKDIAMRSVAIDMKMPYGGLRKGRLGVHLKAEYFQKLNNMREDSMMQIMDASQGFGSADIEMALDGSDADLVIVDAAYRIKAYKKTKDRMENMAEVADDLKALALRYSKPIICTTQLNRDSTKKKSYGDEDVALSDVVGWNATNLFALKQEEEDREKGIMKVFPLKVREGENSRDALLIKWDFNRMDFSEFVENSRPHSAPSGDDWL